MPEYRVWAEWSVRGCYYVKAASAEEACAKIRGDKHLPLPSDPRPVLHVSPKDEHITVIEEMTEELNDG